jgi:hypothetical protein
LFYGKRMAEEWSKKTAPGELRPSTRFTGERPFLCRAKVPAALFYPDTSAFCKGMPMRMREVILAQ